MSVMIMSDLRQTHPDPLGVAGILLDVRDHGTDGLSVRPERLPNADPLHLEGVVLGQVVQHGVVREQLGEGEASDLNEMSVIVIAAENLCQNNVSCEQK